MRLCCGTKLGAYEIVAPVGGGGMGEVYRAHDSSLKRDVAIKVLPEAYASDPERLHRFQLEAQAAATLNHPNIITVHQVGRDDGTVYMVQELLQGETLRERLRSAPLPLRVATEFGVQLARGLAAAHEHGIVHRDLKPENIFVTRDGRIKILDFGLAKLTERASDAPLRREDNQPTVSYVTDAGIAVGTPAYMSPEQARGRAADFHADIFALGVVLYEMVSGKQPFGRPTRAETMTAILKEDPPSLSECAKNISPGLERVILHCLEKQPELRFQSASDLAFALEALSDSSISGNVPIVAARSSLWPWILGAACAVLMVSAVVLWMRIPAAVPVVEAITQLTDDGAPKGWPVSDGTRIYFDEGERGATRIAQVSVLGGRTAPIEHTPPHSSILNVAADGSEMLLYGENGDILALPLPAGEPRRLLDGRSTIDADVLNDGRILYSTRRKDGGSDLMLAEKDASDPRTIKSFPDTVTNLFASPDGRTLLFREFWQGGSAIRSIGIDGSNEKFVMDWTAQVSTWYEWSRDQRFILFLRNTGHQSDIWALRLRPGILQRGVNPIRLTNGALSYSGAFPSSDGKKIFTVGSKSRAELVRYDPRSSQFLPFLPGVSAIEPQFSRDGAWLVYVRLPELSIWRSRADGSEPVQLTFTPMQAAIPRFSPDGKRISFTSSEHGYVLDVAAGGPPKKIGDRVVDLKWSPDGSSLLVTSWSENGYLTRLINVSSGEIFDLPGSKGTAGAEYLNPNTLVAFNFDTNEFVTFDFAKGRWSDLVSVGSNSPCWHLSANGRFLFYAVGADDLQVRRIEIVNRKVETAVELKEFHQATNPTSGAWDFALAPDGSLVFSRDKSSQEIYALSVRWP